MNVYHDDNHELVQPFDKVIFAQQPWRSATPSYNLPKANAFTPIATSFGFQNHQPNITNNFVRTNSKMEQLHMLNRLE
jgi:hypothetical protein